MYRLITKIVNFIAHPSLQHPYHPFCRTSSSDGALAGTSWYSFSGAGYAELPPLKPTGRVQNMLYSVVLSVKTFDEDALLFLAVNEKKVTGCLCRKSPLTE